MVISRLLDENRQVIGDPTNISGTIYVLLDVQPNEETVADIVLTLDGEPIMPACRGSAADAASAIPGLAETGAQVEVECQLETSAAMQEVCVGLPIDPKYANGNYELSAYVKTTKGDERNAFAGQQITLNNHGYVMIAHSPGGMSVVDEATDGLTFYGGPAAEGNVNQFHACPVAYDGTIVGSMRLSTKHTDTSQQDVEGATSLSFRESRFGPDYPSKEAPFTWTAGTQWWSPNHRVENIPGETETWVINDGLITDPDGRDISATFRAGGAMAMDGPHYFDFKAPVRTNDSEVVIATSNSSTHSSWTSTTARYYPDAPAGAGASRFRITELSDMGVGHRYGMTSAIAVGDCGVGANADTRGSTAFVPLDGEGFGNVTTISQLPEEDPNRDGVADGGGVDCYVAEVQSLADRLGNAVGLGNLPRIRTATTFGVDRTPPVISRQRPSEPIVLSSNMLFFELEEPRLENGEDGSQLASSVSAWAGSSNPNSGRVYWSTSSTVGGGLTDAGTVEIDITPAEESFFAREQSHTVYVRAHDMAHNRASTTFTFIRDQTEPALSLSTIPNNFGAITAASVSVAVAGTLSDATEIRRAFLSVHKGAECMEDSDPLPATQVAGPVRRLDNGTNTIEFSEVFTIKQGADLGATNYCFYLHAEDDARDEDDRAAENAYGDQVATFSVGWPGTPPEPPAAGPTFEFTNADGTAIAGSFELTEGGTDVATGGAMYSVKLANVATAPTTAAPLTVTLTPAPGLTVAPTTLTFPHTDGTSDTLNVLVTATHDRDVANEEDLTVTHSATGYGDGTVTATSMDDDVTLTVRESSITEGGAAKTFYVVATLTNERDADLTVGWSFGGGSAASSGDWTAASVADITIEDGDMSDSVQVTLSANGSDDDVLIEGDETVNAQQTSAGEAPYLVPAAVTIMDDDPNITLMVTPSSLNEGDDATTLTISATSTVAMPGVLSVTVTIPDGEGYQVNSADSDATVTLTIDTGNTASNSMTVSVDPQQDDDSNNITFEISGPAAGVQVGGAGKTYSIKSATVTITDDDGS